MTPATPPRRSPSPRLLAAALGTLGSALAVVGCAPAPAPTPTPTPVFTSEEEAFAAAEETYRAYNEAFNSVDASDSVTFEALYDLSSGDFEAADRKTLSELNAEGLALTGSTTVSYFEGLSSEPPFSRVEALVCVDVSGLDVVDKSGQSAIDTNRPQINPLVVTFLLSGGELLINRADRDEQAQCVAD